ncbi:MAG: hypothetical protein QXP20_06215 [Candidatus Bathyarchaeia archaeon]
MRASCRSRPRQTRNSGQVLIIVALAVSLIIISTVVYVYELTTATTYSEPMALSEYVLMFQLGSKHVLISSLTNITRGGSTEILKSNLNEWCSLVSKQYVLGKSTLNYALTETFPYSNGLWIFWSSNGYGVSSVCANFSLAISGRSVTIKRNYFLNISTLLQIQGEFSRLNGDDKQVAVVIHLSNENTPALAKSIHLSYLKLGEWIETDYTLTDYGNGTYRAFFSASIPSDIVEVSLQVVDQRGILVVANATCTET